MYCVYVHTYIIYSFLVSYHLDHTDKLSTNDTENRETIVGVGAGGSITIMQFYISLKS